MFRLCGLLLGASLLAPIADAQILTKSFSPNPVLAGGPTTVTLTLTNNLGVALNTLEFSDILAAGDFTFGAFGPTTCDLAQFVNATRTLTVTQASLAVGASCNVTFTVTPVHTGNIVNTTSDVMVGRVVVAGTAATATLPVVNQITLIKSFAAATIPVNGTTTLVLTINNLTNNVPITGLAFTDTLPATLRFANVINLTGGCGGATVAAAGPPPTLSLTGGAVNANSFCTITADVTGTVAGTLNNVAGPISSTQTGTGAVSNTATLLVLAPPTLTKAFAPNPVFASSVSTLTFTVTNPNPATAVTGIVFSDTLPGTLFISSPNGLNLGTCAGATVTAPAGTNLISLSALTLAGGASCQFSVNVTGITVGNFVNTTSTIASTNAGTGPAATAAIAVASGEAFQVRYAANLNVADSLINITNTGTNGASLFGPGFGPVGNICVNVYAFSPDEQLVSCCSCLITPNGLASLSVYESLRSNTLTGVTPNSMTIKILATGAGQNFTGTTCAGSSAAAGSFAFPLAQGVAAWGTSAHVPGAGAVPGAPAPFSITETRFTPATLSPDELASINNRCTNIVGNGSGFGICRGCSPGGRGAEKF